MNGTEQPTHSAHVSELAAQVKNLAATVQTLCQRLEQLFKLADEERTAAVEERKETLATTRLMQTVISDADNQVQKLETAISDLGEVTVTLAAAVQALQNQ